MRPELEPATAAAVLARTVAACGEQEAYVGPGERLAWKQMAEGARRTAAALHAAGVRKGDHVGLMLGNSGTWIQTFLGIASIGAVTVPVNTRFKADELRFCLRQADVRLLIFSDEFLGIDFRALLQGAEPAFATALPGTELPELRHAVMLGQRALPAGCQSYTNFLRAGKAVPAQALDALALAVQADDVLLIQFTSGTTSFPKGVMLSHANMLLDAQAAARRMGVRADDRYFSIRPFFHVAGSTLSILVSLSTGCCLLSLPKFDVTENLAILDQERCTLISGNDTIFLMLMGHPDFDPDRLHLRGGWAAAGPEVMEQIHRRMRVPGLCNAYRQSEAAPNVLLSAHDDPLELRIQGFGLPHPGVEVRLADPATDEPCGPAQSGEIQVRGWNVMRGYYKMPEATAKAFSRDGWLKTGDLGEMNAEGRVRMLSRLKDMYRVGGENVAPSEVEEVLHAHPAVRQAQVIGVPDARLGEVTGAFVLLKEGQAASREELIDWCRARAANFKVPRYLEIVDTFENIGMTGSSKVQKNKLREHALRLWGLERTEAAA
ncbi:AMP-binding protein [Alicycliphilus sp. T452]